MRRGRYDPTPAVRQARLALLAADQPANLTNIAEMLGVDRRSVHRYATGARLDRIAADRLAVRLGLHPLNLWPEWCAA